MSSRLQLDPISLRVLGCLVEKELTTPEYYPLTLNALCAACNQKTNRDPVLSLEESQVARALEALRGLGLAHPSASGGRATKYAHNLLGKLQLAGAELALLAELLLRGEQTGGELRARAERMHRLEGLAEVEAALGRLAERDPPLVARLPRQPGQKEARYAHLLGDGAPVTALYAAVAEAVGQESPAAAPLVAELAAEVKELRDELRELRAEVRALRRELNELTLMPETPEPEPAPQGSR